MDFLIIFLCLAILFVYKRTGNYLSVKGIILFSLFLLVTFLKLKNTANLADLGLRLDNFGATLLPSTLFVLLGTPFLYTRRRKIKKFKVVSWLISLVGLYFIFGLTQQLFFQSVFTHTLYGLLGNKIPVVISSAVFFASFHWGKGLSFGLMTFLGGLVLAYLFLVSPNLILLGSTHAILASIYYYLDNQQDILKKRFSLKNA